MSPRVNFGGKMLITPGPVKLLDEIREAQSKQMISHRSKDFEELHMSIIDRLIKYSNAAEAYAVTGSGTLGIEMNIMNACLPGDRMLALNSGEFGRRFAEIARIYCEVDEKKLEAGKGWNLERAKEHIDNSGAQVLGMVYNETSLGVVNDIKDILKYAKGKGMRTVVDGVSAWPAHPLDIKEFSCDFFSTGSQKAIGAPPGLSMIMLGEGAVEFTEKREKVKNYYCEIKKHRKFMKERRQTPYTPAVSLFYGLKAALDYLDRNGGAEGSIKRHSELAAFARKRAGELGLKVVAEEGSYSNTITAVWSERSNEVKKRLKEEYGIVIAGGMHEWKGKMFRICHIGNVTMDELRYMLECAEKILSG